MLQGTRGKVHPLPEFARSAAAAASDGGAPPTAADQGSFLVAWDVQAEEGIGPVLLLARAAHCLQQLHVANVARQAVADSEYWQVGWLLQFVMLSVVLFGVFCGHFWQRVLTHDMGALGATHAFKFVPNLNEGLNAAYSLCLILKLLAALLEAALKHMYLIEVKASTLAVACTLLAACRTCTSS
jgi:hypothetical protein